jgi:hypothetical protein
VSAPPHSSPLGLVVASLPAPLSPQLAAGAGGRFAPAPLSPQLAAGAGGRFASAPLSPREPGRQLGDPSKTDTGLQPITP